MRAQKEEVEEVLGEPPSDLTPDIWTAGRVSDSPESGLSCCLSYCSVLLLDLVGRPVPQGGVESFLIVCSSSIQEAISRMALLLVGYTI